jgi:hypothetical protein
VAVQAFGRGYGDDGVRHRPLAGRDRSAVLKPNSSVSSRCCATTLSYVVTRGSRPRSNGGGVLLGEDDAAPRRWFGITFAALSFPSVT